MAPIPNLLKEKIYQTSIDKNKKEPRREYLGGSAVGEECERKLWYQFRHAFDDNFEGRVLRLFDRGKREEECVINDLRNAGLTVYDKDTKTGEQFRYTACNGHLSGGLDGVVIGVPEAPKTPHLLEIKTSNKRAFESLEKVGVKDAKPVHYAQMQLYMGMAELTRALYVSVCKDNDEIYTERVEFDKEFYKMLLLKAQRIIDCESAPPRISEDKNKFPCKWCSCLNLCHEHQMPLTNCKTCVHSTPVENAKWICGLKGDCSALVACDDHIFIPSLFWWADPLNGDKTFIKYRIKSDKREFINVSSVGFPGDNAPHYSSSELSAMDFRAICSQEIEMVKKVLGGKIVEK
jgi:hypothetical protein